LVGEAGAEAVIPLDKANGMGGITININGGTYLDKDSGRLLAQQVSKYLRRNLRLS